MIFCSGSDFAVSDGFGSDFADSADSACSGSDSVGADSGSADSADYCFSQFFHPFQTNMLRLKLLLSLWE